MKSSLRNPKTATKIWLWLRNASTTTTKANIAERSVIHEASKARKSAKQASLFVTSQNTDVATMAVVPQPACRNQAATSNLWSANPYMLAFPNAQKEGNEEMIINYISLRFEDGLLHVQSPEVIIPLSQLAPPPQLPEIKTKRKRAPRTKKKDAGLAVLAASSPAVLELPSIGGRRRGRPKADRTATATNSTQTSFFSTSASSGEKSTAEEEQQQQQQEEAGKQASSVLKPKGSKKKIDKQLEEKVKEQVQTFLREGRKLTMETMSKYGLGAGVFDFQVPVENTKDQMKWQEEACVLFPFIEHPGQEPKLWKIRSVEFKAHQRFSAKARRSMLFGMHTVNEQKKSVVVTEGEFDCMAVHQATGMNAVSLPNGANSLTEFCIKQLEGFDTIYLWMDNDSIGQTGAKTVCSKLIAAFGKLKGKRSIYNITSTDPNWPKDANDALKAGCDLNKMILDNAKHVSHEQIVDFADLRSKVYDELVNPDKIRGVASVFFPGLNQVIKGHRRGELTLFTGRTGVGKTTFLAQLSLDFAIQGIPTLWGSFEIPNFRLAKRLLQQYYSLHTRKPDAELVHEFEPWADKFAKLPFQFMKFTGSIPVDTVLEAMTHAAYQHDLQHVVIDNLQFMTSQQGTGLDKFDIMDSAIHKFRMFATDQNCHVTLVIHPRKEADNERVNLSSLFGTAKSTQEADNVICLQLDPRNRDIRYIDVLKNRFDGTVGQRAIYFDKDINMYVDQALIRKSSHKTDNSFDDNAEDIH